MTTLKQVQRYKSSLLPTDVNGLTITNQEELAKVEKPGSYLSLEKAIASTEAGEVLYIVTVAYWGGDDADSWLHVFSDKAAAQYCYNEYNKPMSKMLEDNDAEVITARVTKPNEAPRFVPGANFKGFFVKKLYGGDLLLPFWNSKKLQELGLLEKVKALGNEKDVREIIGTDFEAGLIKWGVNEYGITVESKEQHFITKVKEVSFEEHHCWETGLTYYELLGRYPKEVFDTMKPVLSYHSEEIEEEGDWKGWYTMSPEAAGELLTKINWKVK